jgi:hypothetical protein
MLVRITHLDGRLPNVALMRLSAWHKHRGDDVTFTRLAGRDLFERDYDRVYGSAIFAFTKPKVDRFLATWPGAILGGSWDPDNKLTVESITGGNSDDALDYDIYPEFTASIGFTQRGCRFNCGFCSVRRREGRARAVGTIEQLWRDDRYPRNVHLLDNDFFGQPKRDWTSRIAEMVNGHFKISFSQGVNIRVITPEIAQALASVEYRDIDFKERRLYTAWDSLGDRDLFFRGVDILEDAGIPARHLRVYMLTGWAKDETMSDIMARFDAMVERGIEPYPMVYDLRATEPARYRELKRFQRYVVTGLYRAGPFSGYDTSRGPRNRARERAQGHIQGHLALEATTAP